MNERSKVNQTELNLYSSIFRSPFHRTIMTMSSRRGEREGRGKREEGRERDTGLFNDEGNKLRLSFLGPRKES